MNHVFLRRRSGPLFCFRIRSDGRGALVVSPTEELQQQPELRFGWLEPGGLLGRREEAPSHDIEPGVGPAVPLEKEEASRRPDGPAEPVEAREPGAQEPAGPTDPQVPRGVGRK